MREIMRAHNRIIPRSLVETDGWLINQAVVSHVAIAVEKSHRAAAAAGKKRDSSTDQSIESNNFVVSRKRFKPSTPGSETWLCLCWRTECTRSDEISATQLIACKHGTMP